MSIGRKENLAEFFLVNIGDALGTLTLSRRNDICVILPRFENYLLLDEKELCMSLVIAGDLDLTENVL